MYESVSFGNNKENQACMTCEQDLINFTKYIMCIYIDCNIQIQ